MPKLYPSPLGEKTSRTWRPTSSRSDDARALYLFGRDLRLADHAGLAEAARFGAVVPGADDRSGSSRPALRSPRRAAFIAGRRSSLNAGFARPGAALIVRRDPVGRGGHTLGAPGAGVDRRLRGAEYDAAAAARQRALQAELEEAGLRASIVHDAPRSRPKTRLPRAVADGGAGYRAFVPYVTRGRAGAAPAVRGAAGLRRRAQSRRRE